MDQPPSTVEIDRDILSVIPPGSKVLELACAHGRTAFSLEDIGFKVTAIDIDSSSIIEARKLGSDLESKIEFLVADGRDLPFDDEIFDACVMNGFLTMLTDMDSRMKAINEASRTLKKGGHLYATDFIQTWETPVYSERYESHERITGERGTFIVTDTGSTDGKELYRAHHHTEEELRGLISRRFDIVKESREVFTSYHGNKVNGMKLLGIKR